MGKLRSRGGHVGGSLGMGKMIWNEGFRKIVLFTEFVLFKKIILTTYFEYFKTLFFLYIIKKLYN